MAVDKGSFQAIGLSIPIDSDKKIDSIRVEIVAENVQMEAGKAVYITDVMLQGGTTATSHVGHVSEIKWSFDNA
jgi:hypothetical protein